MPMIKGEEEPDFFRAGIVYRELGYWLSHMNIYYQTENYFKKAIRQGQENDFRTYIGLCKALMKFAKYEEAVETVEKCREIYPTYTHVRHMMLQTLFQISEFGYSLMHAYQGYQKYRVTFFEHGIYQGNETIEDCMGRNTSPIAFQLLSPWIRELEEHRKLLMEMLKEEVDELAGFEEGNSKFKVNDPEAQAEVAFRKLQRVIAKIFLGKLAYDKKFLQDISEDPDILQPPNKALVAELRALATRIYLETQSRQDIIRTRRPLYTMLFERRNIPKGHRIMMEEEKKLRRNLIVIEADFLLRRLHDVRMRKEYTTFFRMVDRVKDKFDSYSVKMFPLKQQCLDAVYNMVAWMYIDARDLSGFKSNRIRKIYLKHHLGIRVAELPRDCDIAWVKAINRKKALRVFRRRLAMASEPLELAWLFHELSKHLIDIRRHDLARFYIKKARKKGQEAESEQWVLNTHHLLLRIEINQNYRNEAKEVALHALSSSKKLGLDFLVDFYTNAINVIDEMDTEKLIDSDAITARQHLILDLMPNDMKPEVDYLWRSMEAVPAKRRLSVMPGCKTVDRKFKLPCKRMTILSAPPKNPAKEARDALLQQFARTVERPGFVDFNKFE
ncbi:outer dynein arm-docking complex subunit 4 [Osmia lignaria lignaria]|uniref:outer dynein arm-docking complex subunit 4 n=2 Tax=Osmia lignaria TaxID=473952 RepID=UPI00147897CF|nr:tetratricopeptide repeat protein 25-like isoform X1 [Osmia lignaria]